GAALASLHSPPSDLDAAGIERWVSGATEHHGRLALEEFFLLELALHLRRGEERGVLAEPLAAGPLALPRARAALGFELTGAQARMVQEIVADLEQSKPMRRLVQ